MSRGRSRNRIALHRGCRIVSDGQPLLGRPRIGPPGQPRITAGEPEASRRQAIATADTVE